TPFYDRVISEGLMRDKYVEDADRRWHDGCGFNSIIRHPTMSSSEIEDVQRWCFEQDFQRLGPSIYRIVETNFAGYKRWRASSSEFLQKKAAILESNLRKAYLVFLVGRLFGPNSRVRSQIRKLEHEFRAELGAPTLAERLMSLGALGAAAWTALKLRFGILQHPRLGRVSFRIPEEGLGVWAARIRESLRDEATCPRLSIQVDLQHAKGQVWVKLSGMLDGLRAERIAKRIKESLEKGKGKLILDLENLKTSEDMALETLARKLSGYRRQIRIRLPKNYLDQAAQFLILAQIFRLYRG
ncbi:MAG: hypothetical protein ACYS14_06150, partial [Planctomycetota bacterium]